MKLFILILFITTLSLNASYINLFSDDKEKSQKYSKQHNSPIEKFRSAYSYSNALVKKGDLAKYPQYESNIKSLQKNLKSLDISKNQKKNLKKEIQTYARIINTVYNNMKKNTPNIYIKYNKSLKGFISCNNGMESTGYAPLLNEWHNLIKIKHDYMRKPSYSLSQKFHKKWDSVRFILTDLCLDEDIETPLLNYLHLYKNYFDDLDSTYKNVEYSNINRIKPLNYAIKANLEFATSQND